jgi:hypothetical protein
LDVLCENSESFIQIKKRTSGVDVANTNTALNEPNNIEK